MNVWLQLAIAFVERVLARAAKLTWENIWQVMYKAVIAAETKYRSGYGEQKKAEVKQYVLDYVHQHAPMNFIERWFVDLVISEAIDSLVASLNDTLGKSWIDEAEKVKLGIEAKVPFLAGNDVPPPADPNATTAPPATGASTAGQVAAS